MLFVCETDAQLFNAINIKLNVFPMKDADVCIVDTADNREEISNRIKQDRIFKNVYRMLAHRDTEQTFTAKLRKALSYISQTKLWKNIPNKEMDYSEIFIAGPSMNCIKVYYYFRGKNPDIKLHLYEEGVFEYYMFAYKQNPVRRLYSKVIFGCYYMDNARDVYVYDIKMILDKPDSVESKEIPKVSKNDEYFKRCINYIFDFSYKELDKFSQCQYLFIEQSFPNTNERENQINLIRQIVDYVGNNNILVKLHPYSDTKAYENLDINYVKSPYSMELIYLNMDLNMTTIFTVCSSAVLNFKLIFDGKQRLFFLYKLFDNLSIDMGIDKIIEGLSKKYSSELLSIPSTTTELIEELKSLS